MNDEKQYEMMDELTTNLGKRIDSLQGQVERLEQVAKYLGNTVSGLLASQKLMLEVLEQITPKVMHPISPSNIGVKDA